VGYIQNLIDVPLISLAPDTVARGGLIAAERHAAGQTVYFDFLPKIATIVQARQGPINFDLIGAAETLPAGSMYRSPSPARLALQPGQETLHVFLKKETHTQPRKAIVAVGAPPRQAAPIDLWVEQVPAAGRARILMHAPSLARHYSVDWDGAEVLDLSWEQLLSSLASPPPSVPTRLVLPCGLQAWQMSAQGGGLIDLLASSAEANNPDWRAMASRLSTRTLGQYCISSDGALPIGISDTAVSHLDALTDRATAELHDMVRGSAPANSALLRFLTWQFRRCPKSVADLLLDAWEARAKGLAHPLATSPQGWILIRQGLGRIVSDPAQEARAIALLMRVPIKSWSWREETAAAAFLLSRSDQCAAILQRPDIENMGARVIQEFVASIGTDYTRFQYAPFLLVGLLRWRLVSQYALVVGMDTLADDMARVVAEVFEDMTQRRWRSKQMELRAQHWLPILRQTLDELRGAGGNPNLLADIFGAHTTPT
jgi:hypothetical protein